jgi:hypothetical protein
MLRIPFAAADLANVRFAISPLLELHHSVRALAEPEARGVHLAWIATTRGQVPAADLSLLQALRPRHAYSPDFIHPPPRSPLTELEDELTLLVQTPAEQIRSEIVRAYERRSRVPAVLRPFIEDPPAAVNRLADVVRAYWQ